MNKTIHTKLHHNLSKPFATLISQLNTFYSRCNELLVVFHRRGRVLFVFLKKRQVVHVKSFGAIPHLSSFFKKQQLWNGLHTSLMDRYNQVHLVISLPLCDSAWVCFLRRTIFILMGLITQETILLASIIKKSEKGFDGYLCSVQPE